MSTRQIHQAGCRAVRHRRDADPYRRSGARSWNAGFEKLFGVAADIGVHTSAGETDPQVARRTFRGVLGRDPSSDELDRLYAQYLLHLSDDIWTSAEYKVLPGVDGVAAAASARPESSSDWCRARWRAAARTKLMPANLNRYFLFGAYGSDSPDRGELTTLAVAKAARLHDGLAPDQVWVVGTPLVTSMRPRPPARCPSEWRPASTRRTSSPRAGAAHVLASLEGSFVGL